MINPINEVSRCSAPRSENPETVAEMHISCFFIDKIFTFAFKQKIGIGIIYFLNMNNYS